MTYENAKPIAKRGKPCPYEKSVETGKFPTHRLRAARFSAPSKQKQKINFFQIDQMESMFVAQFQIAVNPSEF